jgi:hypothetical protein
MRDSSTSRSRNMGLDMHRSQWLGTLVIFAAICGARARAAAATDDDPRIARPFQLDDRTQATVTHLARQVIPHDYENRKGWGKTRQVIRGLYIKREGLRIKTHRTTAEVNDGTWTKYRVQLLNPAEQFQIRVENVHQTPDQRLGFDILCTARLRISGRLSQWQQGVQLVSISAEADTDVCLSLACDLAFQVDVSAATPGVVVDPVVRSADVQIHNFQMRSISQFEGPLVKSLSASVRELLEDEIADRRQKLVGQLNRHIDKNRDRLHVSLSDLLPAFVEGSRAPTAPPTAPPPF